MGKSKIPSADRFWNKVNKSGPIMRPDLGPCWEWTAGRISKTKPYGSFTFYADGATLTRQAHRVAFEMASGEIPPGMCVLHRCDNPPCVNPDHLFLGTRDDNQKDMARKERSCSPFVAAQVVEIRLRYAAGASAYRLAKIYGVHHSSITRIVRRVTWAHLP